MTTLKGTTWLPCPSEDCVDGMVEVRFEVDPGEEEVRYPNRKAHPGHPAQASILEVLDRADCEDHPPLTDRQIDRLEVDCQDRMIRAYSEEERERREVYEERRMEMRRERRMEERGELW